MNTTKLLSTLTIALAGAGLQTAVLAADDYPTKPIELVVPASAGGGTDLGARTFAKYAAKKLGKPVVIVNMAGAGGYVGSRAVNEAKPDGYKVLYFHANLVTAYLTGTAPYSYDAFDMGPTLIQDPSLGLYTAGDSGIKTINDLLDKAKAEPGKLKAATEYGAFTYFMLLKLQNQEDVKFNMVDVGTDSAKVTALLGGYVDIMPKIYSGTQQYIDSGDFNGLGVAQAERAPNAPDLPTFKEQGVDFEFPAYPFGFFYTKGTPQSIQDKFNAVVKEVSEDPDFQKDVAKLDLAVKFIPPAQASENFANIQKEFTEIAKTKAEVTKDK